jgi:hypothetical protein
MIITIPKEKTMMNYNRRSKLDYVLPKEQVSKSILADLVPSHSVMRYLVSDSRYPDSSMGQMVISPLALPKAKNFSGPDTNSGPHLALLESFMLQLAQNPSALEQDDTIIETTLDVFASFARDADFRTKNGECALQCYVAYTTFVLIFMSMATQPSEFRRFAWERSFNDLLIVKNAFEKGYQHHWREENFHSLSIGHLWECNESIQHFEVLADRLQYHILRS